MSGGRIIINQFNTKLIITVVQNKKNNLINHLKMKSCFCSESAISN